MLFLALLLGSTGQVAKFDARKPEIEYDSVAPAGDVERCLISWAAPPVVYRQPDRPDDAMIVWSGVSLSAGNAAARVDLHRSAAGATHVRAWLPAKVVEACAPR